MATKLILTHEVEGLGQAGDVVEVKDGYARNFLVPRKLATPWTRGAQKQIDQITAARRKREIATVEDARAAEELLAKTLVKVHVRAGAGGRLFGSVTTGDIAEAITAAGGPQVDKRKIIIPSPIKTVGDYKLSVKLHENVTAPINLQVIAAK